MKAADASAAVERIVAMAGDPEAAHGAEDQLYVHVLQAIANGTADDPQALAEQALVARFANFPRWMS